MHAGDIVPLSYSPSYTPPEVAKAVEQGEHTIVADPAADMWALGIMAFELLTTQAVFPPMVATRETIWAQLCGREALPWEAGAPQHRAKVRALQGLKKGVLQCLSRSAEHRPAAVQVLSQWRDLFQSHTTESEHPS